MSFLGTIQRIGTGIVTGGTSELIRLVSPSTADLLQQSYFPTSLKQAVPAILAAGVPAALIAAQPAGSTWDASHGVFLGPTHGTLAPSLQPTGVTPMGFDLGGFLQSIGGALGGSSNQSIAALGTVSQTASNFFQPTASVPAMSGGGAMTVSRNLPAVRGGSLTKEVFDAGLQVLTRLGIPSPASTGGFTSVLKRALTSIATLARRTPTGTMVSLLVGLGLGAYEASLLTIWHAQKKRGRRMNPANSKALRRSVRRIKSFHKLCQVADVLKTRGSRSRSVGRCGSCKKSPCRC